MEPTFTYTMKSWSGTLNQGLSNDTQLKNDASFLCFSISAHSLMQRRCTNVKIKAFFQQEVKSDFKHHQQRIKFWNATNRGQLDVTHIPLWWWRHLLIHFLIYNWKGLSMSFPKLEEMCFQMIFKDGYRICQQTGRSIHNRGAGPENDDAF